MVSWLAVQADIGTARTYHVLARNRWLMRQSVAAIFGDPRRRTEDLVEEVQLLTAQPEVGRSFRAFQRAEVGRRGLRTVYMDQLDRIAAPTAYIHGTHDTLVPVAYAQEAQRRTPGALPYLLRRVGHWPQRKVPQAFNRLVRWFPHRVNI